VVGVVVDRYSPAVWVTPLVARRSESWSVAGNLPIKPAAVLQDLLVRLLHGLGLPQAGAIPERLAFALEDRLGLSSGGASMHVAGLLAVLDAANGGPKLLRRACAVVQPAGDALAEVGSAGRKLDAFRREHGRGTLLVCAPGSDAAAPFRAGFENVWEVDSLQSLARRLETAGLLRVFLENAPLGRADLAVARERLRLLVDAYRYGEALDLARRLRDCPRGPDAPPRVVREVQGTAADLYRHLGYYVEAEELAEQAARSTRTTAVTCYDEQACADIGRAAALYDPHRFDEMERLLAPWEERLARDPLLAAPETRVMVCNTLARARVVLGRDGWAELYRRSLDVLRERDPLDLPRTWNYLAHGLLRHGRADEAEAVLCQVDGHPAMSAMSRWMARFCRAELERQRGRVWSDPAMEDPARPPTQYSHAFAFYFQATARQPGRDPADAAGRFRQARALLLRDPVPGDRPNILRFLADAVSLGAAAVARDVALWGQARAALAGHLRPRAECRLAEHYAAQWQALGGQPDAGAAEQFLRRVPFF
jgi:hypothetical protein